MGKYNKFYGRPVETFVGIPADLRTQAELAKNALGFRTFSKLMVAALRFYLSAHAEQITAGAKKHVEAALALKDGYEEAFASDEEALQKKLGIETAIQEEKEWD